MENGTQEGKVMREWLNQMSVLEEQAQSGQQQKDPQEQLYDEFVASIVKEFLSFLKQRQQKRDKQQQQAQKPPKPPGFNPQPLPPQQGIQQQ